MTLLEDMIQRRHEGPGWRVFTELPNGTGLHARRRADAVAMGLWPSRGYEIHGYEIKRTRGDVRAELRDPSKMDAVGQYCDFWWLVVGSEDIIDGLLVPETWGILAPRNQALRIVRKAPKLKPKPVTRTFVAAICRSVTEGWVSRSEMDALREQHKKTVDALRAQVPATHDDAVVELERLKSRVAEFELASGVSVLDHWRRGNVGQAVKVLAEALDTGSLRELEVRANIVAREERMTRDRLTNLTESSKLLSDLIAELKSVTTEAGLPPTIQETPCTSETNDASPSSSGS